MARDDDLTRAFGPLGGPSPAVPEPRPAYRKIFGTPRLWQGILWVGVGFMWLALLFAGFEWWRLVAGVAWVVLGGSHLAVALRDRTRRQGAYAAPNRGDSPEG